MLRKMRCQPDNENITHERRKTFYLLVSSPSAALLFNSAFNRGIVAKSSRKYYGVSRNIDQPLLAYKNNSGVT